MDNRHFPDDKPVRPQPDETRPQPAPRRPSERIPGRAALPPSDSQPTVRTTRPTLKGQKPVPPPPPADELPPPRDSGLYVPWWGFVIVILAVAAITCGMWWMVLANKSDASVASGPTPTLFFVVITSSPTLGPSEDEITPTQPAPTEAPTSTPEPTTESDAPGGPIQLGSRVAITGTEGDGLAIRQGPGVEYTYFFVGQDGDEFVVQDGPRVADGYVWWYVANPDNVDLAGWAAEDWLALVAP